MSIHSLTDEILEHRRFAVSGVSRDSDKYGFKVYQALKAAGYRVFAVNPNADSVDGDPCYPTVENVPDQIDCLVTVTHPSVTEKVIREASHLHIPYLWMQPGSESQVASHTALASGMQIVCGGPCIIVAIAEIEARRAALA